jgi:cation:H+ antiporter
VLIRWNAFRADCLALVVSAAIILGTLVYFLPTPRVPFWTIAPLLAVMAIYLASLVRRGGTRPDEPVKNDITGMQLAWNLGVFVAGVAALYGGGHLVLTSAVATAEAFQIEPAVIGLTIVAAGTSVPDTIASLIAARRGEHEIAVGNLLGSNISNVLVVLTSTILASWVGGKPEANPGILLASQSIALDYAMVCVVSLLFVAVAAAAHRVRVAGGVMFLVVYLSYMLYRVVTELTVAGLN